MAAGIEIRQKGRPEEGKADKERTEFRRMQVLEFGSLYTADETVRRLRAGESIEIGDDYTLRDFTGEEASMYYLDFFISLAQESFKPTVLLKTGLSGVESGSTT